MTQTYATYERGAWRCYVTPTGKGRAFIGCAHLAPASAVRHIANLDPFVSPRKPADSPATSEVLRAAAQSVGGSAAASLVPEAPAASRAVRLQAARRRRPRPADVPCCRSGFQRKAPRHARSKA